MTNSEFNPGFLGIVILLIERGRKSAAPKGTESIWRRYAVSHAAYIEMPRRFGNRREKPKITER
jgi:hypothetical protein